MRFMSCLLALFLMSSLANAQTCATCQTTTVTRTVTITRTIPASIVLGTFTAVREPIVGPFGGLLGWRTVYYPVEPVPEPAKK